MILGGRVWFSSWFKGYSNSLKQTRYVTVKVKDDETLASTHAQEQFGREDQRCFWWGNKGWRNKNFRKPSWWEVGFSTLFRPASIKESRMEHNIYVITYFFASSICTPLLVWLKDKIRGLREMCVSSIVRSWSGQGIDYSSKGRLWGFCRIE